ncbi:MAG: pre-16S rRNA-processing nuclease YqgF [Sodalinema sp.]|uniref:pre-16S rRNA-processing nuclease YqgF n=1 Tax=Sodalinema sp. TaxID=3080550 RepID=UPI0012257A33|nr:MAG: pre-16S rRNA-processing nuclease YqgF [Phormidium sp. SL48-SHIP]
MTQGCCDNLPLLGFDPGRDKCGVAVVQGFDKVLDAQVVASDRALETLQTLCDRFGSTTLIIGDRTTSRQWQDRIRQELPDLRLVTVNEQNSTLAARDRYWSMYPPRGLKRLIPQGLRLPPRPIDDIVAILLIERYLTPD